MLYVGTCDATVRNLELIGEAATRVSEAVRAAHPQLPWRLVIATRNRLIHGYLAARLFDHEQIGIGVAARIAGVSMAELVRRRIPILRTTAAELERELAAFGA